MFAQGGDTTFVFQAIDSKEDCEDLCNNAPFRCHSFDFNDTGDNVCRYEKLQKR